MEFLKEIISRAKTDKKTIVLPEGFDKRIPEAASMVVKKNLADIIILGKESDVKNLAKDHDISNVKILDHLNSNKFEEYSSMFYEMRKEKGMTLDKARETLKNPLYYGAMMVKSGDIDGMVAGATTSTADTLRCCLQTVKTAPGVKYLSTCTVLVVPEPSFGSNGVLIFTDTAMYENPNSEELSQIALSAGSFFKALTGDDPKIAMLSYSTKGSAKSVYTEKIVDAIKLTQEKVSDIMIDGELQFDAAVIPSISQLKAPDSKIEGKANVFVFPDLNSANIGCKIAERFGNAELYGPVSQGLARPINDVSRGCSARDIVGMIAITILQTQA